MAIHIGRREFIATLGGAATCPLAAAFALAPAVSRPAPAQGWPARPARIVVPYAPTLLISSVQTLKPSR